MKEETFEQFLEALCFEINADQSVQDDDMPDFFDNWISNQNVDDIIKWGNLYGEKRVIAGARGALEALGN